MAADFDLTEFMKEGSGAGVSNLDWLDVDEKAYQAADTLPKENLDIGPDLQALWAHKDESSIKYVPNTGGPKAMVDLSQAHGPVSSSENLVRTARLTIMQTTDARKIRDLLTARFDSTALHQAKSSLASVLAERGLLGRVYVAASDFPDCNRGGNTSAEFVRRHAADAKFVVAKNACGDCLHRQVMAGGASHCGVFHKQIVMDVPFTDALAEEVEKLQMARGHAVEASTAPAKDRIQKAHLAPFTKTASFSGHAQTPMAPIQSGNVEEKLIAVASLTKKRDDAAREKMAADRARPIIATLQREMLKGHGPAEVAHALRLAFDQRDLQETQAHWGHIFREAGLYGVIYTTQDSFEDCREGADFLAKRSSSVRAIVAGTKCDSCIFSKVGRCMMYGRKLIREASEVLTPETVAAVIDEHRIAGRLPQHSHRMAWGTTPVEALKAIHKAATAPRSLPNGRLRDVVERAFVGERRQTQSNDLTKREVIKAARQYLNEGLYGSELGEVLRNRFEVRDIAAAGSELRAVLAEQGLQGIKYVDPTAYDDYGFGCKTAGSKHRSRAAVRYAKAGDKCGSCVHQTQPGVCSVLSKQLVREVPYVDRLAEQRAILASGRATEVSYKSLMNNGLSMMQEYELQHSASSIELSPERSDASTEIEFGAHTVKL